MRNRVLYQAAQKQQVTPSSYCAECGNACNNVL